MTKGTTSQGQRNGKCHGFCPRCGKHSFHIQSHRCAHCAYPNPKFRRYNWAKKAVRRRSTGTGRMSHILDVQRRWKNHFREGTIAKRKNRTPREKKPVKTADPKKKDRRLKLAKRMELRKKQKKGQKVEAKEAPKENPAAKTQAGEVKEKKF